MAPINNNPVNVFLSILQVFLKRGKGISSSQVPCRDMTNGIVAEHLLNYFRNVLLQIPEVMIILNLL